MPASYRPWTRMRTRTPSPNPGRPGVWGRRAEYFSQAENFSRAEYFSQADFIFPRKIEFLGLFLNELAHRSQAWGTAGTTEGTAPSPPPSAPSAPRSPCPPPRTAPHAPPRPRARARARRRPDTSWETFRAGPRHGPGPGSSSALVVFYLSPIGAASTCTWVFFPGPGSAIFGCVYAGEPRIIRVYPRPSRRRELRPRPPRPPGAPHVV